MENANVVVDSFKGFMSLVPVLLQIIGVFAVTSTVLPNRSPDGNKISQFILDLWNFLGANFGRSQNKDV